MHGAGEIMLLTSASVNKRPWYNAGRGGLKAMATSRYQSEAVMHDCLPFWTVGAGVLPFVSRLPIYDQVGHFMGDGMKKVLFEVLCEQRQIDSQTSIPSSVNSGLTSAAASQSEIDC
jgi:hypothetical protein